jgi:hypothetical protein
LFRAVLAHIQHAHAGLIPWQAAHQQITAMVRHPVSTHPDTCGLDHGAPAVAFTLHAAHRPTYASTLAILDQHIATLTNHRLTQAHHRIDAGQLPALREYDLIHGLTGIGAYLLHRHGDGHLLRAVLAYLVRLSEPITIDGKPVPGWWSRNAPNDQPSPAWPGGHGNLGMAHGIAGPLALLSTALRYGITVAAHATAIERICTWLDQWRAGTNTAPWWPETITRAEHHDGNLRQTRPGRPSWCYGTPGLARAQQLAGLALTDPRRQRLAEHALTACLADPAQLTQLTDTSLCHGWAGLLQTTWRVATDATNPDQFPLPDLLRHLQRHMRHAPTAAPGLLTGAAGAQLAHHTVTLNTEPLSGWDTCVLLGGGPAPHRPAPPPATTHGHQISGEDTHARKGTP